MANIVRQNFSERVALELREKILNLEIEPGKRLIVEDIANSLGVSRTPIREGLRNLAKEGLVIYDGKSYFVRKHCMQEIEDLFSIRRSLELTSVKQAAQRRDQQDLNRLRNICKEAERLKNLEELEPFIAYDKKFHNLIAQVSKNSRLQTMLEQLNDECWWINRYIFFRHPLRYSVNSTYHAHCEIVQFIEQGHIENAVKRMEQHIIEGEQRKYLTLKEEDGCAHFRDQ